MEMVYELFVKAHPKQPAIREVSLYVITYENPYVVHAGERGQLSYVNVSTDFRRKAVSYVGSSVGLFEIFFAFSGFILGNV